MAEEKKTFPFKELISFTKFAEDKAKSRRLAIGMVGYRYYIQIAKPDDSGKLNFKDRKTTIIMFGDQLEAQLVNAARNMMQRLKYIKAGKDYPFNNPIILYGGRDFKKSNYKVEFNIIQSKKDNNYFPLISIKKYKKDEYDKPESEEKFFFGEGKLYFKKEEVSEIDTRAYAFFEELKLIFESIMAKTNISRADYMKAVAKIENGEDDSDSDDGSSYSSEDDDDVF